MFETTGLKTFAMSAKDLNKAVEFYTNVLGGQITRRVEPTAEQLNTGHVKEVDVRLGNFEVHLFDASKGPRAVDPHHTLNIPWQDQEKALSALGVIVYAVIDPGSYESVSRWRRSTIGLLTVIVRKLGPRGEVSYT